MGTPYIGALAERIHYGLRSFLRTHLLVGHKAKTNGLIVPVP